MNQLNFDQITCDLRDRLIPIFLVGPDGRWRWVAVSPMADILTNAGLLPPTQEDK